jgi:hypothetical protein
MDRLNTLTWKYFLQQKQEEIYEHFEDSWGLYASLMVIFGFFLQAGWISKSTYFVAIIGLCFIGLWALIGLIALIRIIYKWISNNWKKAKARARKELRR